LSQLQIEENEDGRWVLLKLASDGTWTEVSEHASKNEARRAQQDYLVAEQYA
jgi:hypothetical protein